MELKMLLLDATQVHIYMILAKYGSGENIDLLLVKQCLRRFVDKLITRFGQQRVIWCYDANNYWRKDYFSFYKKNRKSDNKINWNNVHRVINILRFDLTTELESVFTVANTEADDLIAVLCSELNDDIIIVSTDKDFKQLLKYTNVKIWDYKKQLLYPNDSFDRTMVGHYLKEHIIRGDKSDGVPNILSSDDSVLTSARQKPITKKNIENWINCDAKEFCSTLDMEANYIRNQRIIDFDYIPPYIKEDIIYQYSLI